jgi:hypothetical protein
LEANVEPKVFADRVQLSLIESNCFLIYFKFSFPNEHPKKQNLFGLNLRVNSKNNPNTKQSSNLLNTSMTKIFLRFCHVCFLINILHENVGVFLFWLMKIDFKWINLQSLEMISTVDASKKYGNWWVVRNKNSSQTVSIHLNKGHDVNNYFYSKNEIWLGKLQKD